MTSTPWRPWFAWWPRHVNGRWRWLCWLEQRFASTSGRQYVEELKEIDDGKLSSKAT